VLALLVDLLVSVPLFFMIIRTQQETLLKALFVISAAALAFGVSGALLMSSLLLRAIRKLVKHVELIRDAEDWASLANLEIKISGRDEVAVLGKTINEMTQ
jgi:HAMP domain-containing protein